MGLYSVVCGRTPRPGIGSTLVSTKLRVDSVLRSGSDQVHAHVYHNPYHKQGIRRIAYVSLNQTVGRASASDA
eukprot:2158797-Amphidinium_carterae.1